MVKKVLMILAHPDDEILFGWPIFMGDYKRTLIMCSTDFGNKQRQWCSQRKFPLLDICKQSGTDVVCFDNPSSFFRLSNRDGTLSGVFNKILQQVDKIQEDYDFIFTHNPHGEYGHIDHRMLFNLVLSCSKKPILYTDILFGSDWPLFENSERVKKLYYQDKVEDCVLNKDLYNKYEGVYRSYRVWAWNNTVTEKCSLYVLR